LDARGGTVSELRDMTTNELSDKERTARDLGWDSYDDAPKVVQNNIDSIVEGPALKDPFRILRPEDS